VKRELDQQDASFLTGAIFVVALGVIVTSPFWIFFVGLAHGFDLLFAWYLFGWFLAFPVAAWSWDLRRRPDILALKRLLAFLGGYLVIWMILFVGGKLLR
jgi:hypothetical protein